MTTFPVNPSTADGLLKKLKALKKDDLKWRKGRAFSYIYYADPKITETLSKAYELYFSENALNPSIFPSLKTMEQDVIQMCIDLFNGSDTATGVMTSGGTESILMAVKSALESGKKNKEIKEPELIMPITAHPAFNKACDYFGVKPVIVPVSDDFRVDPQSIKDTINDNTILIVASAPSYPQGVVDPIPEIGKIAKAAGVFFHVDACIGGFVLPFVKNRNFPDFDLGVEGVSSLSADIHKYGFASKGSSVLIYNCPYIRRNQFYIYTKWPGGIYASPSILGTKPGGAIAVAWTVLQLLGKEGYEKQVEISMRATERFKLFLSSFDDLEIVSNPDACIFSIKSNKFDIYELGDELYELGWQLDRQQNPASLHLSISPIHNKVFDEFAHDFKVAYEKAKMTDINSLKKNLKVSAAKGLKKILPDKAYSKLQKAAVKSGGSVAKRSAAIYGMIGDLQGTGSLDELILDYLDNMTR